jgi:mRNA interferase YafQ
VQKSEYKTGKMSVKEFFDELINFKSSMFDLDYTGAFKSDLKACYKSNLDLKILCNAIKILAQFGTLPREYKPHLLTGKNLMECHIKPDWLLIWKQDNKKLTLLLVNTGSHTKILKM